MQAVTWYQRDAAGKIKNFMELKILNVGNISQELIPEKLNQKFLRHFMKIPPQKVF